MCIRDSSSLAVFSALAVGQFAHAQLSIEIAGVGANRIPVAIADFAGDSSTARALTSVIRSDLSNSGLFRLIEGGSGLTEASQISFPDMKSKGADALVAGLSLIHIYPARKAQLAHSIESADGDIDQALESYGKNLSADEQERKLFEAASAAWNNYRKGRTELLERSTANDTAATQRLLSTTVQARGKSLNAALDDLTAFNRVSAGEEVKKNSASYKMCIRDSFH